MANSDDILYYNLSINSINKNNSGLIYGEGQNPIKGEIQTFQTAPILKNPNDYYGSIIRFSVPCLNLPIIQFLVQTPVLDINKGIYSFTLKYQNFVSAQTFIQFIPEFLPPAATLPPVGTNTQTFSNYYFLYDYVHLVKLLNNTLVAATASLNTIAGTSFIAPFFYFDSSTSLISLYAVTNEYEETLPNPVEIWFNSSMAIYMQALPYYTSEYGNSQGLDNKLLVNSNNAINLRQINGIGPFYTFVPQQYVSVGYMSYLNSIIIGTDMNIVSDANYVNNASALQNQLYVNILTDFKPDLSVPVAGASNSIFIYNAPSLYRLFSFKDGSPLYNLSAKLYFTDNLGNVYPLYLDKGTDIQIKFMFIKKDLVKSKKINEILSLTN